MRLYLALQKIPHLNPVYILEYQTNKLQPVHHRNDIAINSIFTGSKL